MTSLDDVLLPEGARLVHIGPHKTGTTTLQGAFHLAREAAASQGVHYAGPNRQPLHAAQAIAKMEDGQSPKGPRLRPWRKLVEDVERATAARTVISSEWFADAREPGIRAMVRAFDPGRMHVAVTLRPLGRILASQWQQFAQAGQAVAFERWLEAVFHDSGSPTGARFWHRHRHDQLVDRWAAEVGPDRLTVVVADDRDRGVLLRAFERLVGLHPNTLAQPDDRQNRSLTLAEIELVRELHGAMRGHDVDAAVRLHLALFGVAGQFKLRVPDPSEARLETPGWALDESTEIAVRTMDRIRASGVRVIGDLADLARPDAPGTREVAPLSNERWARLTASTAMGVLWASGLMRGSVRKPRSEGWPDELHGNLEVEDDRATPSYGGLSTERLLGVLTARVRQGAGARLGPLRRARRWGRGRGLPRPKRSASAVRTEPARVDSTGAEVEHGR